MPQGNGEGGHLSTLRDAQVAAVCEGGPKPYALKPPCLPACMSACLQVIMSHLNDRFGWGPDNAGDLHMLVFVIRLVWQIQQDDSQP